MNSTYGKFGQKDESGRMTLTSRDLEERLLSQNIPYRVYGDFINYEESQTHHHTFTGIASLITDRARLFLHRLHRHIIDKGGELYYSDTDSVHTNISLPESEQLGGLKLEYSGDVCYAGKKLYALKDSGKVVSKGFRGLTYEDILELSNGGMKELEIENLPTIREAMTSSFKNLGKSIPKLKIARMTSIQIPTNPECEKRHKWKDKSHKCNPDGFVNENKNSH
jgi:hypothetical protein